MRRSLKRPERTLPHPPEKMTCLQANELATQIFGPAEGQAC